MTHDPWTMRRGKLVKLHRPRRCRSNVHRRLLRRTLRLFRNKIFPAFRKEVLEMAELGDLL